MGDSEIRCSGSFIDLGRTGEESFVTVLAYSLVSAIEHVCYYEVLLSMLLQTRSVGSESM